MLDAAGIGFSCFHIPTDNLFIMNGPIYGLDILFRKTVFGTSVFHDFRHTSAPILINQGVHAKIISEQLGHGSIITTMNIYGHALRTADQAVADKFESLFTSKAAQ